jgi:hypothetical protein
MYLLCLSIFRISRTSLKKAITRAKGNWRFAAAFIEATSLAKESAGRIGGMSGQPEARFAKGKSPFSSTTE